MAVGVNQRFRNKLRRAIMWGALGLIILLVFLSIYGAFIGPDRAEEFFNSVPLAIYWVAFASLLAVAIAAFRRLLRVPALLLVHAGCVLILAGAIWGSEAGHKLQKKLFGIDKILTGQMQVYEGYSDNRVILEDDQIRELPFYIRLKDFRIKYYKPEYLLVHARGGQSWKFPVETGRKFSLGDDFGTITIARIFRNFKISIDGEISIAIDDPGPGSNPALEVRIECPDGEAVTRYVFERFPGHGHRGDELFLSYARVISDYVSELQVISDGKVVTEKDIEVNHPLHFGGYHFYQHSYDDEASRYTVLMVASDTGLRLVYAGYCMLCIGVFWRLWIEQIVARVKARSE